MGILLGGGISGILDGSGISLSGGGGGGNEVPVNDEESIGVLGDQLDVQSDQLGELGTLRYKDFVLDCTVWGIVQGLTEDITASTIGWVNTGFGGDPFYLTDPDVFFANLEDQVTQSYIDNKLERALRPSNYRNTVLSLLEESRTRVTLDELLDCPVGNKVDNLFSGGDPDEEWDAFLTVMTNPACTPHGSYTIAQSELTREIASVKDETNLLIVDGFLPKIENGQVTTPAKVIESQLNSILDSGLTKTENADELSELITNALLSTVTSALSDSSSLRDLDTSAYTGTRSTLDADDFTQRPPRPTNTPEIQEGALQSIVGDISEILSTDTQLPIGVRSDIQQNDISRIRDGIGDVVWGIRQVPPNTTVARSALTLMITGLDDAEDKWRGTTSANLIQLNILADDLVEIMQQLNTDYSLGISSFNYR